MASQPKKPTGGGYGIFLNENRAKFQKEVPAGSKVTAVSKLAGEKWKALSAGDKAPYEKKYGEAKAKYEKEMKAFLDGGGVKETKASKRKAKEGKKKDKDPNRPKKPAGGGYGCFLAQNRPEFTKQCAGKPASAISKLAGEKWKALGEADKKPYEEAYAKKKQVYEEDMKAYKAKAGDEDEDDDDEEEEEGEQQ